MASFPLLFDLHPRHPDRPTARDIARTVKAGGTDALTEAERRADNATYQEITCRSALNRVEGMPFRWTLNPYRGCTHGCHYCFARRYHIQFEMNVDDEFASVILIKHNIVEVLERELDRSAWTRELVAFGTATDPYQPIEGKWKLTRRAIQALTRGRTPFGLVTKGPMVVRDIDVLLEQTHGAGCTVYMSVPTVDEEAWSALEPGTAHPLQRLRAVKELVAAGVNAGVLMAPIVPGFSSSRSKLERTVQAVAEHDARFLGYNVLHLQDGTRSHFLAFIAREFPALRPRYERLYTRKYAPEEYRKDVGSILRALQEQYGLARRGEETSPEGASSAGSQGSPGTPTDPEQAAFRWR